MNYKLCFFFSGGFILVYIVYTLQRAENEFRDSTPLRSRIVETVAEHEYACPEKLVLQLNSEGGLGNQMMDYATAYVAVRELSHGHVGMADGCQTYLKKFFTHIDMPNITADCKHTKDRHKLLDTNSGSRFKELYYSGLANPTSVAEFSIAHDNVVFSLYDWLPILYPKYLDELRHVFTFREAIVRETKKTFDHVQRLYQGVDKPLLFVGVHVRRKDYDHHLKLLYNIPLLGPGFFLTAMEYFQHKYSSQYTVVYLAVSNDVDWVTSNIKFQNFHVVSKDVATDMALLSLCNHTITDYGTFGFLPSLMHGGEHYTTNVYEDFIVVMMKQMKSWTVIKIDNVTPLVTDNDHPSGWLTPLKSTEPESTDDTPVYLKNTW